MNSNDLFIKKFIADLEYESALKGKFIDDDQDSVISELKLILESNDKIFIDKNVYREVSKQGSFADKLSSLSGRNYDVSKKRPKGSENTLISLIWNGFEFKAIFINTTENKVSQISHNASTYYEYMATISKMKEVNRSGLEPELAKDIKTFNVSKNRATIYEAFSDVYEPTKKKKRSKNASPINDLSDLF